MKRNNPFFILLPLLFLGKTLFATNYDKATKIDPEIRDAYIAKAKIYEKNEQFDKVITDLKNIEKTEKNISMITRLGEKFLLTDTKITNDPLIYDHLGDIYVALNKPVQAWIAYSLSFDFKENKRIRKKLNSLQKQIPLEEFCKQMLIRSENNYLKLTSFKTGFKIKISSNFLCKKFYVPFSYYESNLLKIGFPATLIHGEMLINIKNGTYEFIPKNIENQLPQEVSDIISKTYEIFGSNFYSQFVGAKIMQKGKRIIYSKEDRELVLNLDTALIESFFDKDLMIIISKYEKFGASNVPKKVKFVFKNIKIKGLLELIKISFIIDDN